MKEIIVLKKLYAEIRKWEKMPGTTLYKSMRLLKLYIGMGIDGFMTRDGKILCQDFNRLAKFLGTHNPKKMIDMVVESDSFVYEKCDKANMNYYGIMWFASPFFYKSDKARQKEDTAQLLSETGQTVNSKDGRFHLLNKYIKDFSNIPSGGIACAHASDSWGVAPTATWNFRTRKNLRIYVSLCSK